MSINKINIDVQDKYIKQSFEILNFFKSIIIEVHHIGSSKLPKFPYKCDMDILFIVKSYDNVRSLADILIAEGYVQLQNFSNYFKDDMVMRRVVDGQNINMIFLNDGSHKKNDILQCTERLLLDDDYFNQFKQLKKSYLKESLTQDEYEERKYSLFQVSKNEGDHLTSV